MIHELLLDEHALQKDSNVFLWLPQKTLYVTRQRQQLSTTNHLLSQQKHYRSGNNSILVELSANRNGIQRVWEEKARTVLNGKNDQYLRHIRHKFFRPMSLPTRIQRLRFFCRKPASFGCERQT